MLIRLIYKIQGFVVFPSILRKILYRFLKEIMNGDPCKLSRNVIDRIEMVGDKKAFLEIERIDVIS